MSERKNAKGDEPRRLEREKEEKRGKEGGKNRRGRKGEKMVWGVGGCLSSPLIAC